ncbi:MAG: 4-hydroxybenzoate octaprenyltransferase [Sphingobium sp.]
MPPSDSIVPDSEARGMMALLPPSARDYASMARLDRPIGWWLLFWPGAWAIALAGNGLEHWRMILWFLLGSIAMRGAGCVWNDIVDRDLDRRVARTASRPVASGRVSPLRAAIWMGALCLVGLIVLFQLRGEAQIMALASLAPVAAYPFMKRITWWPQVWLGIVFSWAALVGWVEMTGALNIMATLLYLGSICWVVGYDSIYALQDREDDGLVGIRSSALAMGRHVRAGVGGFYAVALALWAGAIWLARPDPLALVALLPMAGHLGWQVVTLREDGVDPLVKFRSNRFAGFLMFAACVVVGGS